MKIVTGTITERVKVLREMPTQEQKCIRICNAEKEGPFGIFQHPFCRKTSKTRAAYAVKESYVRLCLLLSDSLQSQSYEFDEIAHKEP